MSEHHLKVSHVTEQGWMSIGFEVKRASNGFMFRTFDLSKCEHVVSVAKVTEELVNIFKDWSDETQADLETWGNK